MDMESRSNAQVTAEFTVALLALVLFVAMLTRLFCWMGKDIVARGAAFETTRQSVTTTHLPPADFYNNSNGKANLSLFTPIK
jgi:hypothetical protein